MKNKKLIILVIILAIISNVFILMNKQSIMPQKVKLTLEVEAMHKGEYQFFYSDGIFEIGNSITKEYTTPNVRESIEFELPTRYNSWRIDLGSVKDSIKVYEFKLSYLGSELDLKEKLLNNKNENKDIKSITEKGDYLLIETKDGDPQSILNMDKESVNDLLVKLTSDWYSVFNIIICVAIDMFAVGFILFGSKIIELFRELYSNKKLIFNLSKNDFKTKFVGSYLGIVWAFIQPVITIVVYWFVFQVGLRSGNVGDFPFILWLVAGLVPWFFFSDAIASGTSALIEYQYLVKKVVFKISILPFVKVLSAMFVHLFFMALAVVIYAAYGYTPDLYTLQIVYYTLCVFVLALALVYFTCSILVFLRDTSQIVAVFLQVGIWMTPIMWQVTILPSNLLVIFKAMPMYYVVMGYRDSLINKVWFFEKTYETAWFWGVTLVLFAVGTMVFKKLKVHFADVL